MTGVMDGLEILEMVVTMCCSILRAAGTKFSEVVYPAPVIDKQL
jgi:hypothetical protein